MSIMDPQFPPAKLTPKSKRTVRQTVVKGVLNSLPKPGDRHGWKRALAYVGGTLAGILGMKYLGFTGEEAWMVQNGAILLAGFKSGSTDGDGADDDQTPVPVRPSPRAGRLPTVGDGG